MPQVQSSQVSGLTMYQAALPDGTIQPGDFTVAASGGADVGAFQSTIQIGSPIHVTTPLAGLVLHGNGPPLTIRWTGGDPNTWVTVRLIAHNGGYDYYPFAWVARASDGELTIQGQPNGIGFQVSGPVELVIDVVPDPSNTQTFAAPGLSLGGRTAWRYRYRFEGVQIE